jgi:hypothetical protein
MGVRVAVGTAGEVVAVADPLVAVTLGSAVAVRVAVAAGIPVAVALLPLTVKLTLYAPVAAVAKEVASIRYVPLRSRRKVPPSAGTRALVLPL